MMDSKQLALVYLTEEANKLAIICTKNVHSPQKYKTHNEIAEQMGKVFCAMREVVEELKMSEEQVEKYVFKEHERRLKDK